MKGIIFVKPLEYSIEAHGEKWRQGDTLKGTLKIKHHGNENYNIVDLKICLSFGNFKKIKEKDAKAWELLEEKVLAPELSLGAGEEKEFPFSFKLPEDCPITDKGGSLYLVLPEGQLELVIEPKLVMSQFMDVFQTFLRFKLIQTKFNKGMVEFKMNPPTSREMNHIDSLVLRMKEVNKTLDLHYTFNVQVFETVAGNVGVQKKVRELKKTLAAKDYLLYGDAPNQDYIKDSIHAAIKEAAPRILA